MTTDTDELVRRLRADAASYRRMADSTVRMNGPTAVVGEAASLRRAADNFDEAATALSARIEAGKGEVEEAMKLTEYEMQVLIGTSISGCVMPPDIVFDLKAAWKRLHGLGLIDRTDGLAIITDKGKALVIAALEAVRPLSPEPVVKALEWRKPDADDIQDRDDCLWLATGMGGRYAISTRQLVRIPSPDGNGYLLWDEDDAFAFTEHLTAEAAKAAAQADYETRILSALHPAPAPRVDVEPDWKRAFAAQSRKLQAVLHIPGVKEALATLTQEASHE